MIIMLFFLVNSVSAETVIYDNISTLNYKVIKIDDITNFKYVNEYPYVIYIDGNLYGKFTKDEEIAIPDNSEVVIYVPSPIKSDLASSYDLGKSILGMGFFLFLGFGILAAAAIIIVRKFWRK
jgi:hypothetical protein